MKKLGIEINGETPNSESDYIIYKEGKIVSYSLTLNNKKYILANNKQYILKNGEGIIFEINEEETTYEEDGITIYKTKDWEYIELENGKIQLTKYTGNDTTLIVPSKINGKEVYSIGSNKAILVTDSSGRTISGTNATNILGQNNFNDDTLTDECESIASFSNIIFSEGIEEIGITSFYLIKNIYNVQFSNTIKKLDHLCFKEINLNYLEIPEQITYLGQNIFMNNYNLKKVIYNAVNAEAGYYDVPNSYFYPILYNAPIEELIIGKNVKFLPDGLFYDVTNSFKFEEITIPENIVFIGKYVFINNINLKKVNFNAIALEEAGVYGTSAFPIFYNSPLEEINIGPNVTIISKALFFNAKGTFKYDSVIIPYNVKEIKGNAFYKNSNLKSIIITNGLTNIEKNAFKNSGLTTIYFKGTEQEFLNIKENAGISTGNDPFINATVVYE